MAVPGVRGSSDLPTALASGRGLRSQREERLLTSPLLKGRPSLLLRYHRVRSSHSHRVMASNARSRRREASSVSRPSQGEQFGTCNWDRAHVPPEVIRPRIGRHEDCRERQPCQCRHGYGPYANAHRVCHGSREAPSARPAPLASVLLFLDTGCQGGLKRNKQRTCTPSARPLSARGLGRLRGSDHPQRLWRQRCRLAAHSFRGSGSRPSGNRVKRRRLAQRRAFEEAEFSGVLAQRWGGLP